MKREREIVGRKQERDIPPNQKKRSAIKVTNSLARILQQGTQLTERQSRNEGGGTVPSSSKGGSLSIKILKSGKPLLKEEEKRTFTKRELVESNPWTEKKRAHFAHEK